MRRAWRPLVLASENARPRDFMPGALAVRKKPWRRCRPGRVVDPVRRGGLSLVGRFCKPSVGAERTVCKTVLRERDRRAGSRCLLFLDETGVSGDDMTTE